MIGGNLNAIIQIKDEGKKNSLGERIHTWTDFLVLKGWLDFSSGDSKSNTFNAKIQESTHVFICDYQEMNKKITAENSRFLIDNKVYSVMLIDDPMNLHQHLEFYLKFVGGQNG